MALYRYYTSTDMTEARLGGQGDGGGRGGEGLPPPAVNVRSGLRWPLGVSEESLVVVRSGPRPERLCLGRRTDVRQPPLVVEDGPQPMTRIPGSVFPQLPPTWEP